MTLPTANPTPSSTSPIPSARSNSRTIGPCTTGSSSISRFLRLRGHPPVSPPPLESESPRLNLPHTVLSKRVLTELVRGGHVGGWDDPRMPTLAGLRRRGVPAEAVRDFVKRVGVAKANSVVDIA